MRESVSADFVFDDVRLTLGSMLLAKSGKSLGLLVWQDMSATFTKHTLARQARKARHVASLAVETSVHSPMIDRDDFKVVQKPSFWVCVTQTSESKGWL